MDWDRYIEDEVNAFAEVSKAEHARGMEIVLKHHIRMLEITKVKPNYTQEDIDRLGALVEKMRQRVRRHTR